MKNIVFPLAIAGMAVAVSVGTAVAQAQPSVKGYVAGDGGGIVRGAFGQCWRTGYWSEELAVAECEAGTIESAAAKAPPPAVAAPHPSPSFASPPAVAQAVSPPAPAVVAALPNPVQAPPPPLRRIALAGKTSFAVGKANLSPAGQAKIDSEVVAGLGVFAAIEAITIEGHTDPTGREDRNLALSRARAEAVKAHLVAKGVKPELIQTEGMGSTRPLPDVNCDRKLPRARLSACYEPLRRIEIAVKGVAK